MRNKSNRLHRLFKKPYLKSIIILSSGSLLAQVINFLGSIVVARQYSGETIGYFTYIISIVAMFSTVVNGRYDVPIVSVKTEKESYSLIKLSIVVSALVSALVTIGVFGFVSIGASKYENNYFALSFVFPLLLIAGLINILNSYNNRHTEYKLISSAYFVRTVFQNIIFLLAGFFNANVFGLLIGQLIGQFSGIKRQSGKLIEDVKKIICISKKEMICSAKQHSKQLLYSVPASFINAVSYSIISIFIGNYFGMASLGLYSYSVRVLGLPLSIFSGNIAKVHFKEATEEIKANGVFPKSTKKMIAFSAIIAVTMTAILMRFGPFLFGIIYGDNWIVAGQYVRVLAPMFGLRMIVGAIGFSFIIANKQRVELIFQVLLLLALGILVVLVHLFSMNIELFLLVLSTVYSVVYLGELIAMLICSCNNKKLI